MVTKSYTERKPKQHATAHAEVTAMAAPLDLQVFTSGPQAFSATSSLVSGARDAVLIDAQFTLSEAHRLAALIYETGKRLTTSTSPTGTPTITSA